jgi:hypothetical protein
MSSKEKLIKSQFLIKKKRWKIIKMITLNYIWVTIFLGGNTMRFL